MGRFAGRSGSDDADLAPLGFILIHDFVGAVQEMLDGLRAAGQADSQTVGDGYFVVEGQLPAGRLQPLPDDSPAGFDGLLFHIGEQDDEFIAAHAADEGQIVEALTQDMAEGLQQQVAGFMAIFIIGVFEVIEVGIKDADQVAGIAISCVI